MPTTRIRERTPGEIEEAIIDLAYRGYTPVQIERALSDAVKQKRIPKVPSLRTIQRIVARVRPPDQSGAWQIEELSAEEACLVLAYIADATVASEGRITSVSRNEARWVARIRSVFPSMPFSATARLAALYQRRREVGEDTHRDLDAFLAFAPWEDEQNAIAHQAAKDAKWIAPEPTFLADLVNSEWLDHQSIDVTPDAVPHTLKGMTVTAVRYKESWKQRRREEDAEA